MTKQPCRRRHPTARQFASFLVAAHLSIHPIQAFGSFGATSSCSSSFASATSPSFRPSRASPRYASASGPSPGEEKIINGESNPTGNLKPRTGWTHNQPGKDSDFWRGAGNDDGASSAVSQSQSPAQQDIGSSSGGSDTGTSTSSDEDEEPRTGWLHNAKSKAALDQEARRQQQRRQEGGAAAGSSAAGSTLGGPDARQLLRREMEKKARNHRILNPPTFHAVGDRRVVVTEHKVAVPLRRASDGNNEDDDVANLLPGVNAASTPSGPTIDVFFTVVETIENDADERFFAQTLNLSDSPKTGPYRQTGRADLYVSRAKLGNADEMILYLQGGPGFGAPAPIVSLGLGEKGSWAAEALAKGYKRVVLMDQRGTGRSTPITKQTLQRRFPDLFALDDIAAVTENDADYGQSTGVGFATIAEQLDRWEAMNPELAARVGVGIGQAADYMACFRADSIVGDAEDVKTALLMPTDDKVTPRPWGAALGQSFGGFCMMSYLSLIPNPPKVCLLTGGIAPMLTPAYDAYTRLWDKVKERNMQYYDMYPGDIALVKRIVKRLLEEPATLPSGGKLTARRFLQLGLGLGGSPSAFASMHALFASAFVDEGGSGDFEEDDFTKAFLKRIDSDQSFDDNPIYFLMHESIYADGHSQSPTDWAAHRAYLDLTRTPSEFSYELTAGLDSDDRPTLFSGEMVFPWMADGDYAELSGFGMRALAQSLACKDDWTPLYNKENMRRALAPGGPCKAAAAVYYDDMYVDFDCSMAVAARGGPLEHCKVYVTNEYQHSGLRDAGASIFVKLLGMAKGSVRTPS